MADKFLTSVVFFLRYTICNNVYEEGKGKGRGERYIERAGDGRAYKHSCSGNGREGRGERYIERAGDGRAYKHSCSGNGREGRGERYIESRRR